MTKKNVQNCMTYAINKWKKQIYFTVCERDELNVKYLLIINY